MVIALEGLPGAGKTTTAARLASALDADAVCETTHDHPFLTSVYRDDERFDLEVELAFLLLHASAWRAIDRTELSVTDFSPYKDILFADDMLTVPADHDVFTRVYERLYTDVPPADLVIYLRASPELCLDRARWRWMKDARRLYEEGLTIERLQRMARLYDSRLGRLGDEVRVLNVDDLATPDLPVSASIARVTDAAADLIGSRLV